RRSPRALHPFPTRRSSDLVARAARADGVLRLDDVVVMGHRGIGADVIERGLGVAGLSQEHLAAGGDPAEDLIVEDVGAAVVRRLDRKSTRLNSSHLGISYA